MKKYISLLLVSLVMMTCATGSAFAETATGTDTNLNLSWTYRMASGYPLYKRLQNEEAEAQYVYESGHGSPTISDKTASHASVTQNARDLEFSIDSMKNTYIALAGTELICTVPAGMKTTWAADFTMSATRTSENKKATARVTIEINEGSTYEFYTGSEDTGSSATILQYTTGAEGSTAEATEKTDNKHTPYNLTMDNLNGTEPRVFTNLVKHHLLKGIGSKYESSATGKTTLKTPVFTNTSYATWQDADDTSWYTDHRGATNVFTISTERELGGLAALVNGVAHKDGSGIKTNFADCTIRLARDMDLAGKKWIPIGTNGASFRGTFDGNGYTIQNLTIAMTNMNKGAGTYGACGLFGYANGATIRNVALQDASVSGTVTTNNDNTLSWFLGALVGIATNSTVENISAQNVSVGLTVPATWEIGNRLGGRMGQASDCQIHRIVMDDADVTCTDIDTTLVGHFLGGLTRGSADNLFYPSDATLPPFGSPDTTDGTATFRWDFYRRLVTAIDDEDDLVTVLNNQVRTANGGATGCEPYAWWRVVHSTNEPVFLCTESPYWDDYADRSWYDAGATNFSLSTGAQFAGLAQLVNEGTDDFSGKTIELANNINLLNRVSVPIGTTDHPFAGTFKAEGHTLSNLNVFHQAEGTNTTDAGFFGMLSGQVFDLCIQNAMVEALGHGTNRAGAVAGRLESGGRIQNFTLSGEGLVRSPVLSDSEIQFGSAGGAVGYSWAATVSGAFVSGAWDIAAAGSNTYAGGVAGYSSNTTNLNVCVRMEGSIYAGRSAGGAIGQLTGTYAVLANAVVEGPTLSGEGWLGGILGRLYNGNFYNVLFSDGTIVPNGISARGAIAGQLYNSRPLTNSFFGNNFFYWNTNVLGRAFGVQTNYSEIGTSFQGMDNPCETVTTPAFGSLPLKDTLNMGVMLLDDATHSIDLFDGWTQDDPEQWPYIGADTHPYSTEWYYADPDAETFELGDIYDWFGLAALVNGAMDDFEGKTLFLTNSISFSGNDNFAFASVGKPTAPFRGTLQGQGGIFIYNICFDQTIPAEHTEDMTRGLIGYAEDAFISGLTINNPSGTFRNDSTARLAFGTFLGHGVRTVLSNCAVNASAGTNLFQVDSRSSAILGGMVGILEGEGSAIVDGSVEDTRILLTTTNNASTTNLFIAGGILGLATNIPSSMIDRCSVTGSELAVGNTQSGQTAAGGIAGFTGCDSSFILRNCDAHVTLRVAGGTTTAGGGIVGNLFGAAIENSWADGSFGISNQTSIGHAALGGIAGFSRAGASIQNCASFAELNALGASTNNYIGGILGASVARSASDVYDSLYWKRIYGDAQGYDHDLCGDTNALTHGVAYTVQGEDNGGALYEPSGLGNPIEIFVANKPCDTVHAALNAWVGYAAPDNVADPIYYWWTEDTATYPEHTLTPGSGFCDYSFGDRIYPPEEIADQVDWPSTLARYATNANFFTYQNTADAVVDTYRIYACPATDAGGDTPFSWVLAGGGTSNVTYIISAYPTSSLTMYWTDPPYNAPSISLKDKTVDFYGGNTHLYTQIYSTNRATIQEAANNLDGFVGLYYDNASSMTLYAGSGTNNGTGAAGCVLLVYSSDQQGLMEGEPVPITISEPSTRSSSGIIGQPLKPKYVSWTEDTAKDFSMDITGTDDAEDGNGAYLYRYTAGESYLPKHNCVFPLRPSGDTPWNASIWWKQYDHHSVAWPVEHTQYSCDWPTKAEEGFYYFLCGTDTNASSGNPIFFPTNYTVELSDYQEPAGVLSYDDSASSLSANQNQYPAYPDTNDTCFARGLVRLTGTDTLGRDNIWFLSLGLVANAHPGFNTTNDPVDVATAITHVTNAASTFLEEHGQIVSDAADAYIYPIPTNSSLYNPTAYTEPHSPAEDEADVSPVQSAVFFVNVDAGTTTPRPLEVWFSSFFKAEDLPPDEIPIPCLSQHFVPQWPETADQIVLASGLGAQGWSDGPDGPYENEDIPDDYDKQVYYQNDPDATGYNPNEEHAYIGSSDNTVWAVRNDLNIENPADDDYTSKAAVLVQCTNTAVSPSQISMRLYYVVLTNSIYPTVGDSMEVGSAIPNPQPIADLNENAWLTNTYWNAASSNELNAVFCDRKGNLWARRDTEEGHDIKLRLYYTMPSDEDGYGFYFPSLSASNQPAAGTPIPWLAWLNAGTNADPITGIPYPWTITARWPDRDSLPAMSVAQTLTEATDNLPEVWNAKSIAVLWPTPTVPATQNVARLFDPTVIQSVSVIPAENDTLSGSSSLSDVMTYFNFEATDGGNMVSRGGHYFFKDLPPSLSSRIYLDPTFPVTNALRLKGELDESAAGIDILYINRLTDSDADALCGLMTGMEATKSNAWRSIVQNLADKPIVDPNDPSWVKLPRGSINSPNLHCDYSAVDHYALTSFQDEYVVLVENNATNEVMDVDDGDSISLHVFRINPTLYAGRITTREDEVNLLSQNLDVVYQEQVAGDVDTFTFEWRLAAPIAAGEPSQVYGEAAFTNSNYYTVFDSAGTGPRFTIGAENVKIMLANRYVAMRYRPTSTNTPLYDALDIDPDANGHKWSAWVTPTLAEGWVQRVFNNFKIVSQRMTDLYDNAAETAVSTIQQIGAPYEGQVALNQDNTTSVGLLELLRTVFDQAESLSIDNGRDQTDDSVNQQLLFAAHHLADFYMSLGNEAYSDAVNPTIGFGSTFTAADGNTFSIDYGAASSGLFCFDNQCASLLDEELALLRGRPMTDSPVNRYSPCYNRLLWNFTGDTFAGEVAYAVNYNITGAESATMDADTAATLYPQGHGDAFGHYLSALSLYYRLLRNPNYNWGEASDMQMLMSDNVMDVDYFEEERFAEVARALSSTALSVLDRTARQLWRDADRERSGLLPYTDPSTTAIAASANNDSRGFGYGDWGARGGCGALVNWAVANSLLPAEPANADNTDQDIGLANLSRAKDSTAVALRGLASDLRALQAKVDQLDAGMNPLGFSENAIPFDISPVAVETGESSHFEQILARAETSLQNAHDILDRAQIYASRLRQLEAFAANNADACEEEEQTYTDQLIAIFGYPFSGDIGPGKTYAQGYDGPDLYHYTWIDYEDYGITSVGGYSGTLTLMSNTNGVNGEAGWAQNGTEMSLDFDISSSGMILPDADVIATTRRAQGSIQKAYGQFAAAHLAVTHALAGVNAAAAAWTTAVRHYRALEGQYWPLLSLQTAFNALSMSGMQAEKEKELDLAFYDSLITVICESMNVTTESQIVGMANDVLAATRMVSKTTSKIRSNWLRAQYDGCRTAYARIFKAIGAVQAGLSIYTDGWSAAWQQIDMENLLDSAASSYNSACSTLQEACLAAENAQEEYLSLIAEGERLLEAREAARIRATSTLTTARYNDLFLRSMRNNALGRYETAFNLAQKYAWLAAKAYDYETGGLISRDSNTSGASFLNEIVAARAIGETVDGAPLLWGGDGDGGLSDILARMKANWLVLKPRLGINNPDSETTWFSLRRELFRILPGEDGDLAFAKELRNHWVDDIRAIPEYNRFCRPMASATNATAVPEPGIVIEFPSTIDFAKNFFAKDLAGGDHAFNSSATATKIFKAVVAFDGYNATADSATTPLLSSTPYVYLVPAGSDKMRTPGTDETDAPMSFHVVNQVVPAPFEIGGTWLDATYTDLLANLNGTAGESVQIRRHAATRAAVSDAEADDATITSSQLIGRSVWNTKWLLIIPAGSLGANRDVALTAFIDGLDHDRDGTLDQLPVRDIRLGLKTYTTASD